METKKEMKLYRTEDIAAMMGITRRTLYNYMEQGKIHGSKIGKYWYFTQENLEEFLKGDKQS